MLIKVLEDQAYERRRDRHWANRAFGPVLELSFLPGRPGVGFGLRAGLVDAPSGAAHVIEDCRLTDLHLAPGPEG